MCLNTSEQPLILVNSFSADSSQANQSLCYNNKHPYSYSDEQRLSWPGAVGFTSTETKVNHSLVSLHRHRTDCEVLEEKGTACKDVVFSQLKDNIYAEWYMQGYDST